MEKAFIGESVEEAVAEGSRYAVALHLRTLDFIEGKNATDAAAEKTSSFRGLRASVRAPAA